MVLPNSNDLKAKIPTKNSDHDSRLENLKSSLKPENPKIRNEKKITKSDELEEYEVLIGSRPLLKTRPPQERLEPRTPPSLTPSTPDSVQLAVDTPYFEHTDPNYEPPRTPRSRRELQAVRPEPPSPGREPESKPRTIM